MAGALATVLSRWDKVTDPVSFLGSIVLLGLPVALIAGIDWARDRVRAAMVIVCLLLGAAFEVFSPETRDAIQDVRHHRIILILAVVAAVTALAAGRAWRTSRARARQGDAAG
jgi:uncharacterized membrane protein